ncbi:MAG: ATP-binding protein [Nocardiopsaceae bacterium]|jgi:anti-sigma regulatory factor (Ser/Thr protein kinase)|nr:ATP-binding protein [Nocardiopsaceae bacterium]
MATVEVTFTPLAAHVRTARLVATAVARRSGVAETLLDEVRLAVGEACSRAVETHASQCPDEPVRVALSSDAGRFEIEVVNAGKAEGLSGGATPAGPVPKQADGNPMPPGFSLAVIAGLADDVQICETEAGTSVKMSWPLSGSLAAGSPA